MAGVAQLSGVPYIQPVILLAAAIITTIQQVKENTKAFARLAQDTYTMVQAITQIQTHSAELERGVQEFMRVLERIQNYINELRPRSSFLRMFAVADDASKIQEYRGQIRMAREVFEMQMHMRTHENIVLVLLERRERTASRPPPYTPEDINGVSAIPEHIRRIVNENFDSLLPILGVFHVFQGPPTIKQISRVLGLTEEEVRDVWGPILTHLEGLDSDGKTKCLACLERLACRADGTIDFAAYHTLVAQWCLLGPKGGAKDIFYAADSWVHHICHSSPSLQLRDALRQSDIPLAPESHEELPEIIACKFTMTKSSGKIC
ncbi:hypothetical protein B0H17DRAFT_1191173 [Mycena rosella]|uniref:Uncharacterized protein n=1 Tax=Mycena rosella TaxID=1033263 RepID=A0AAD7GZI3_MYCRO|nr:hypothetical protein B0H17DRAFT_1191173 [Mycena rosella]